MRGEELDDLIRDEECHADPNVAALARLLRAALAVVDATRGSHSGRASMCEVCGAMRALDAALSKESA